MDKDFDVLHVGLLVADLPLKLPYDVLDFTMDAVPMSDIRVLPGGDAANAAAVMARLGSRVALCSKVGDDSFGEIVQSAVRRSGVDVSFVREDPSSRTTISVVLINAKGDRTFLVCRSSSESFCLEDIPQDAFRRAKHVNFGSLFGHPKLLGASGEELFRRARQYGCTTSADVTHDSAGAGFEGVRDLLQYVDYFLPSYGEALYLSGEREPERMADFFIRETGDKTVVIKLGEEGCYVRSGSKSFRTRAFQASAIDTTGAGDNFVAGFLSGLTRGWELERCAEFGCGVAGLSVQYLGATSPEVSMERVLEFMKNTPKK